MSWAALFLAGIAGAAGGATVIAVLLAFTVCLAKVFTRDRQ